jgi:hypothetical protein
MLEPIPGKDQFPLEINRCVAIIITGLLIMLFIVPVFSQQDAAQNRTQCIRECRQKHGSDFLWGGGGGNQQLYYQCLTGCDKKYWKELEEEIGKD